MRILRLLGLLVVAAIATTSIAVSAAAAELEPLLSPVGAQVESHSGEIVFLSGANGSFAKVVCGSSLVLGGIISSPHLIGNIVAHYLSCVGEELTSGKTCPVMSKGSASESGILTVTLHAVLGLALLKTGTAPAVLVLPGKGTTFLSLLGSCIELTALSGSVAGLIRPIGVKTTRGTIVFNATSGGQEIKHFLPSLGGLVLPELIFFGSSSSISTTYTVLYNEPVEVS